MQNKCAATVEYDSTFKSSNTARSSKYGKRFKHEMCVLRPVLPAACKFESEALQCNCQQFQTVIQSLQSRSLIPSAWISIGSQLVAIFGASYYYTISLCCLLHRGSLEWQAILVIDSSITVTTSCQEMVWDGSLRMT